MYGILTFFQVDSSSDMYSLGIVLFELHHPFKTEMERSRRIQDLRAGHRPDLWQLLDTEQLICQLTDVEPARRPSARDLLTAKFSNQHLEALDRWGTSALRGTVSRDFNPGFFHDSNCRAGPAAWRPWLFYTNLFGPVNLMLKYRIFAYGFSFAEIVVVSMLS